MRARAFLPLSFQLQAHRRISADRKHRELECTKGKEAHRGFSESKEISLVWGQSRAKSGIPHSGEGLCGQAQGPRVPA